MATFTAHTYRLVGDIDIFFTDSGAPPNSTDYTTLLVLHGSAFNGRQYHFLFSMASKGFTTTLTHLNLRTILWNRRDYPGSTRYTDAELEDLTEGRKVFMDKIGQQIADFIVQFIEKENIPQASPDFKAGGVAVMGWSMGTASVMTLFSDPTIISPEVYGVLEKYVRDLILDDPPYLSFGYEVPKDVKTYDPWTDPDCKTPEELYQNFGFWVSSFYDHKNPHIGNLVDLDMRKRGDEYTVTKWTEEEFNKYYTADAAVRSELKMYVEPMQTVLRDMAQKVFYDEKLIKSYFPKVKITLIVGTRTNWHCIWGPMENKRRYDAHIAQAGKTARPVELYPIEGGNHFAHWEAPKTLLERAVEGSTRSV
ncbi:hypothetical protein AAF712_010369 [Marasmius tenuissimus]|uniref:AB hydrolase-1 domain-containing protein n=1 Tax=Marasmius tenuissimus TaxID=585030 RepID=A0ABR2ZM61_9AGAR